MMNLKKTLAVVLAFAMILSMGLTSMAAYSDVTAGTVVSEAVDILSGLNILTGFEDGTFKPDETVTRAQMAAIICRMLGYEDQAQSSMGSTVFNDVAADHWASGYINVAQAQQIINGYGDGNYGPEDLVTYEQAVKMIVSALGYDLPATQKGGYPTGYLAIASAQGITKNANGRVGDAAARATVAVLVYNALEVDLFEQDSWSTDGGDSFSGANANILTRYLNIQKFEGVVTATPLTNATSSSYKKDDKAKFSLGTGTEYWDYVDGDFVLKNTGVPSTAGINASLVDDVNKYLGKKVVAYIGEYADNTTGDRMLYAIAEKNGANETMTINVAQLVSASTTANKIEYKVPGSVKTYDVALNSALTGYVNFDSKTNTDIKAANTALDTTLATNDFAALAPTGGSIELIDSDPTVTGYDVAIITKYNAEAVVKAVETVRDVVKFDTYVGIIAKFDKEAEDELAIVYKDGVVASIDDIAEGDTVNVAQVNATANKVRVFYVSSASVTGTVEGYQPTNDEVYIGGETYKPSIASGYAGNLGANNSFDLAGKEGIFYLNVDGQIAYADASAAKGNYGLILNVGKSGSLGAYAVTVALADGTVATYDLASKLVWNTGSAQDAATVAGNIAAIMQTTNATTSYAAAEAYTHADVAAKLLCTVKLNADGKIKSLVQVNASAAAPGAASKYSEETLSLGSKSFDETSVMFALKQVASGTGYDAKVESSDVQVGTVAEFLVDEEQYYVTAYDMDANTTIYAAALGYNLVAAIPVDSDALIVSSTSVKSYNDDEAVVVNGIQAGEEVSYVLYNENGFRTANAQATGADATEISTGDIILVSAPDADGIVGDFQMLYKKIASTNFTTGIKVSNDANGKKDYYHVALVDETVQASNSYIWLQSAGTGVTTTENGKHFFVMQRAANYTLVDYTVDPNGVEPEVLAESANKYLVGEFSEETTTVFVRVIDEKVVDVVAYRTKP